MKLFTCVFAVIAMCSATASAGDFNYTISVRQRSSVPVIVAAPIYSAPIVTTPVVSSTIVEVPRYVEVPTIVEAPPLVVGTTYAAPTYGVVYGAPVCRSCSSGRCSGRSYSRTNVRVRSRSSGRCFGGVCY